VNGASEREQDGVTRVYISVDTEFSIAGAFDDPQANRPVGPQAVYCNIEGRSAGLGHLLETLGRHGARATFFVETLNTHYFGDEPMGEIARGLHRAGHDVQLHLHPCWAYFESADWAGRLRHEPPNDDICLRDQQEMERLIRSGIETFGRWALPAPNALRTGGLRVSRRVYEAMRACGMTIASNVGVGIYRPSEPELRLYAGRHRVGEVVEIPVTSYLDRGIPGRVRHKSLTVTGSSWPEVRSLLRQARATGMRDIVILTHPFEFVKHRDISYQRLYPNRITRDRLERLCHFIANDPGFSFACIGEAPAQAGVEDKNALLSVSPLHSLGRMMINRINDAIVWW